MHVGEHSRANPIRWQALVSDALPNLNIDINKFKFLNFLKFKLLILMSFNKDDQNKKKYFSIFISSKKYQFEEKNKLLNIVVIHYMN